MAAIKQSVPDRMVRPFLRPSEYMSAAARNVEIPTGSLTLVSERKAWRNARLAGTALRP